MTREEYLKFLIESKYKSIRDFSIQANIPYTTVRTILEKGIGNARVDNIIKICDSLGISAEQLNPKFKVNKVIVNIMSVFMQLDKSRQTKVYNFAKHELNKQIRFQTDNKAIVTTPTESQIVELAGKLSAGGGTFNDKSCVETVEVGSAPSSYDLAFQVTGDSMHPTFEDGEVVFVKMTDDVFNGQIGAIEINNEAFIKKMYLENNRLRLVSLNADVDENGNRLYPDFYADELDDLYIIGRVII